NQPTEVVAPDGSIAELTYNEATLLERVDVRLLGAADATAFIANIAYNARGERITVDYGNGTSTHFTFDPQTFRLQRLLTRRPQPMLPHYRHTFDPVGNVVRVHDGVRQMAFHDNGAAPGDSSYTYDALYQLIHAAGREQRGQNHTRGKRDGPTSRRADHPHD